MYFFYFTKLYKLLKLYEILFTTPIFIFMYYVYHLYTFVLKKYK